MFKISKSQFNFFLISSFGIFGFAALVFQVVFVRKLVLLFGLTAPAIATVLAVFFFGLALGSFIFGKVSDKISERKNFRLYAVLFVLTGIYGFLFPFIFKLLNILILSVNDVWPLNFSGFNFFAFLFAFIFLAPPAVLFGAGFPVINKILVREEKEVGKKISFLYFVNTFGSVLGALTAGFWLIPAFGNNTTIFIASGLSLVVGGMLLYFFKSLSQFGEVRLPNITPSQEVEPPSIKGIHNPIFLYVLFLTGFLALALEVLYTKTLILFIGSSTYAFSLILITFLLGIALGSWMLSFFADKIQRGYAHFGVFLGLIGFWLFLTARFFEKVPFWYLNIFKSYESFDFGAILSAQSLITFLVIFPATFLMGMVFPLGIKLAAPDIKKLGQGIGKLYFANTFGGVLGSLAAGFLFLPNLGYHRTLILFVLTYLALAGFFVAKEKNLDRLIKGTTIFFIVFWAIFSIFSSPWSKQILSLGFFPYARTYINIDENTFRQALQADKLLFYREGLSNIAVIQRRGETLLRINGKTDASNSLGDKEAEILIGALPMLFHDNPEDVLVIGLGSGISLGSITQFDEAKNIDLVEIDPAIVEASDYFKKDNHDALRDPRVRTIISDGRNYLTLTDKKYDVISSEPSNFWVEGNALLFTKEFYELTRSRLKENGVMLQWLQAYSLDTEDIKSILKTFQSVFPNTYLFDSVSSGDLFIIGSARKDPMLDFSLLEKKFNDPKIQEEFGRIYTLDPYQLMAYLVAGNDQLKKYSQSAKLHTDNRLSLEFSAPKTIYKNNASEITEDIFLLRKDFNPSGIIRGGDSKTLQNYFSFYKILVPVKKAFAENDLFTAIDAYKEIRKTGYSQYLFEAYLLQNCRITATFIQISEGEEAANAVWEKCGAAFDKIEIDAGKNPGNDAGAR